VPSSRAAGAAHVFVDDLAAPALADDDHRHLAKVLRLRAGEPVTVSDGRGGWSQCVWTDDGLGPLEWVMREDPPDPPVTVAFALTKGDRPEWVVQKLTEIGVDVIRPFTAERSVVKWDAAKAGAHHRRFQKVAREAAMQSRRAWLPRVEPVVSFAATVAALGPAAALAHPGGDPPKLDRPALLVGPEGGFAEAELACGLPAVGLGPTVLRAETAALAAGLALAWLRAGVLA
jgi:16S rRNA (uracil1498-N3)-methyltransferase